MKKNSVGRLLALGLIVSLAFSVSALAGYSLAAYLNAVDIQADVGYATDKATSYFAGGTGTEASPYEIATADQLRSLQKLNMLGIFDKSTYFEMTSDITWSGDALKPIGSNDYPFDSQFNGGGKTITDLVVNGDDTREVGMFGYVGINSRISNLLLSHPTVNVTANSDGGNNETDNILASYLDSQAQSFGDLTVGSGSTSVTVPASSISATIGGQSVSFDVTYESSNTDVLSDSGNGVWSVTAPSSDIMYYSSKADKYLYTVQLTAKVFSKLDDNIIAYTVERWNIEVDSTGAIYQTFKNLWPSGSYEKLYVGFFIGVCDGGTSYLGLIGGNSASASTNGRIIVNNRAAYSYCSLIGKTRSDNEKDSRASDRYNMYFDLTKNVSVSYSGAYPYSSSSALSTQNSNAVTVTNQYVSSGDTTTSKYVRFYPTLASTNVTYYAFDDQGNTVTDGNGNPIAYTSKSMRFNEPLQATVYEYYKTFLFWTYLSSSNMTVDNGMWLWTSLQDANTGLTSIFNSDSFEVQINLTYIMQSASTSNYFQILYNAYDSSSSDSTDYDNWQDLSQQSSGFSPVQIIDSVSESGYMKTASVSFVVDKSSSFWEGLSSWWTGATWTPMFAIGVGKSGTLTGTSMPSSGTNRFSNLGFTADSFNLYLLNAEVFFTSAYGNSSTLISNTDYIYDNSVLVYSSTDNKFTTWNTPSDVKVGFDVSDTGQSDVTYAYYRGSYGTKTVYATYNNANYVPFNTDGYKSATIQSA